MDIWDEIKKLAIDFNGKYRFELTRNSRIEDDLHITGDDADDFLRLFIEKFDVDYEGFDTGRYFDDEGFDPIGCSFIIWKIMGWKRAKKSKHKLTLGDLEDWVKRSYWINPEETHK